MTETQQKAIYPLNGHVTRCATEVSFCIYDENDRQYVLDVQFIRGTKCDGALKALAILANGCTVTELISKLENIPCEGGTSCASEFARVLRLEQVKWHKNFIKGD